MLIFYKLLNKSNLSWFRIRGLSLILSIPLFAVSGQSGGQAAEMTDGKPQIEMSVGVVTLTLGQVYVIADSNRRVPTVGSSIYVGDQIYTEMNGHVHLRFIDDALVSVRPGSTLKIERYDFDKFSPAASAVKFSLSEGVARSISGEAAKSARGRFRLNTPVAAIGVRGTDFVVDADFRSTRALVNEGAIVMAPFSASCSVEGFGPCSGNAVELAGNSFEIVEINGGNILPRTEADRPLSQVVDIQERFRLFSSSAENSGDESDQNKASEVYMEARSSNKVNETNAEFTDDGSSLLAGSLPRDYTPTLALSPLEVEGRRLVWGRFAANSGNLDFLSLERAVAADGRNVTIAASNYLLYRDEPNGARVDSNLGVVGFELDSAQAFYNTDSGQAIMRVAGGSLNVDFTNSQFSTSLQLDHDLMGNIDFNGKGRIADGGYLLGLGKEQSVVGAVSTDAQEAGYFFERQFGVGNISGLTLWGGL
jgi:hypothetical protein